MSFLDDCHDVTADRVVAHRIAAELRDLIAEAERMLATVEGGALPEAYEGLGLELKALQCKRLMRAEAMARALATKAATAEADAAAQVVMAEAHNQRAERLERRTA